MAPPMIRIEINDHEPLGALSRLMECVEHLIAERAVESLDERVLVELARLDI